MKKVLFMIIIAACLIPISFINQGYCDEKPRRVMRNCGIQNEDKTDIMPGPCKHLNGFTIITLWPEQALIWDEMVYFSPKVPEKSLMDFFGFVTSCDEIVIKFNDEKIKKHCIRNGENEEMLYAIYNRKYILDLLEENDDFFIRIEIKNVSQKTVNIIIKRVEPPSELKNSKTYFAIK